MVDVPFFGGARDAEEEAVLIAQALVRIDTSKNEIQAAMFLRELLEEAGYRTELIAPVDKPSNANLVAWIPGEGEPDDALLIHGHLDTVDVAAGYWPHPPRAGVIEKSSDGEEYLHGLGSMDNKGPVAAAIASFRQLAKEGKRPQRHIRFIGFAGEERLNPGSQFLVAEHPEVFEGVSEVQGLEVGGFSVDVGGKPVYIVQSGESGDTHGIVTLTGETVHSGLVNRNSTAIPLGSLMAEIQRATLRNTWGGEVPLPMVKTLRRLGQLIGHPYDSNQRDAFLSRVHELNPTLEGLLRAGTQHVIQPVQPSGTTSLGRTPGSSELYIAMRPLPLQSEHAYDVLRQLVAEQERHWRQDGVNVNADIRFDPVGLKGYSSPLESRAMLAMTEAIKLGDPDAEFLEIAVPMGTDNKQLLPLDCVAYTGICPLRLPRGYDPLANYHVPGERIPTNGIRFATRTMTRGLQIDAGRTTRQQPRRQPGHGRAPGFDERLAATGTTPTVITAAARHRAVLQRVPRGGRRAA